MTNEEIYQEYYDFVEQQMSSGNYDTIPHCDSRILHDPSDCVYCDRPEWQLKRRALGIVNTGCYPNPGEISCPADAARPPNSESDHRRWGGNKPTIANGDEAWPEETVASKWMYGDPLVRPEVPIVKYEESGPYRDPHDWL